MFTIDHLFAYFLHNGLVPTEEGKSLAVSPMDSGENLYRISVVDLDEKAALGRIQKVLEQVDRDDDHPVVMNGTEVISQVIQQPEKAQDNERSVYNIVVAIRNA